MLLGKINRWGLGCHGSIWYSAQREGLLCEADDTSNHSDEGKAKRECKESEVSITIKKINNSF